MRRSWRARAAVTILLIMFVGTAIFVGLFVSNDNVPACTPLSGVTALQGPDGKITFTGQTCREVVTKP
jgi:hypothetical protein